MSDKEDHPAIEESLEPLSKNGDNKNIVNKPTNSTNRDAEIIVYKTSKSCLFVIFPLIILSVGMLLHSGQICEQNRHASLARKYYMHDPRHFNMSSVLKHVHFVLRRLGWEMSTNASDWDLLWTFDYPFGVLKENIMQMKETGLVNHFPGCGYYTNKVTLSTIRKPYIPRSFKLPTQKQELLEYAMSKPNVTFVKKKTTHREIAIEKLSSMDLDNGDVFIQEFISRPFLVDGRKFDIGIYVIITSINPLRVYYYKGDVLFRYCTEKYYPFQPDKIAKYVVGSTYTPGWELPSLSIYHLGMGFGMRDSFEAYLRSKNLDPSPIWKQAEHIIADVLLTVESQLIQSMKAYKQSSSFFELVRFDFILDENLTLYLMEANMSPNLSSGTYSQNRLLYEQVLYNLFTLTGISTEIIPLAHEKGGPADGMVSSMKNIVTWANECFSECKYNFENNICSLCRHSLEFNGDLMSTLHRAYKEHLNRADTKRIVPPSMQPVKHLDEVDVSQLSVENSRMYLWFQGKCNNDVTFCV